MNTNYSKIALLLALGVIAGEAGANSVEFYPKNVLNLKVQADSVSTELSRNANKISEVNKATGDVVKAMKLVKKDSLDNYTFRDIPLAKASNTPEVEKTINEVYGVRQTQLKALEKTKKVFKELTKDLNSLANSNALEAFFPGNEKKSQLKFLEDLGSGIRKDIDDSVIRDVSGLKFDSKYRCITPDEFFSSGVAAARDGLINALRTVPGVVTVDKTNYNMSNTKEFIKNFADITVSRLAIDTTKLIPIDNANYLNIMNLTRRVGAFDDLFSKITNIMEKSPNKKDILKNIPVPLDQIFNISTLLKMNGMDLDGWVNEAAKLWNDSQNKILTEKKKAEQHKGIKLEEAVKDIQLELLEGVLNLTSVKEGAKGLNIAEFIGDFNDLPSDKVGELYVEVDNALKKATSSSNKLGKIKSVNDFLKAKSSSSYVEFDKSLDDADHNNIRDHFNSVQIYIDNNKESPSFPENARKTKEELVKIMARVEADYARDMQNLVGNSAKSTSKMFKDLDREAINSVYAELKTSYAKVMQSLGDNSAPVVLAKKAAEAKTFADLEASDEFKAKTLKVTDISEDLKKVFAAEKDAGKANDMYAKIHTSLAVDPITKAPAEADVKALKELFAQEVQAALVAPATTQTLEEKAEEAKAKAAKAAEEEKAAKEAAFSVGYLNLTTGTAANAKSKEAIAASKALLEEAKKIVDELTSENEGTAADLIKAKKAAAVEMIDKHVENFELSYVEGDGADDAAAKNKAVAAATKLITAKVNAAFGIANVGKTKKGQKVVKGRNSRGRNSRGRNSRGRNSRGRNSKADVKEVEKVSRRRGSKSAKKENRRRKKSNAQANLNGQTISND